MLKEYTTKPQTVLACKMEESGEIKKVKTGVYRYTHRGRGAATTMLEFTIGAKQPAPVIGDFVIHLAKDDIYGCEALKFRDKYTVQGMKIK